METFKANIFHDGVNDVDAVQRLDSGGAIGQNADGAGGGDRRDGGVAQSRLLGCEPATFVRWERSPFLRESARCFVCMESDKSHQLIGDLQGFVGVVRNTEPNQDIGEAHDAETDLSGPFGMTFNRGEREESSIEHVIEKPNCQRNDGCQPLIVNGDSIALCREEAGDVDRAERTGFIGKQRLFTAGVGGFDLTEMRRGICPVDGVEKQNAWFAGSPGRLCELVEDRPGGETPNRFRSAWVDQGIRLASVYRSHESIRETDREVEVRHFTRLLLQRDEVQDIGVVDPQDPHVGAPPRASLFDDIGGHVKHAHEGDRA